MLILINSGFGTKTHGFICFTVQIPLLAGYNVVTTPHAIDSLHDAIKNERGVANPSVCGTEPSWTLYLLPQVGKQPCPFWDADQGTGSTGRASENNRLKFKTPGKITGRLRGIYRRIYLKLLKGKPGRPQLMSGKDRQLVTDEPVEGGDSRQDYRSFKRNL